MCPLHPLYPRVLRLFHLLHVISFYLHMYLPFISQSTLFSRVHQMPPVPLLPSPPTNTFSSLSIWPFIAFLSPLIPSLHPSRVLLLFTTSCLSLSPHSSSSAFSPLTLFPLTPFISSLHAPPFLSTSYPLSFVSLFLLSLLFAPLLTLS